MESTRTLLNSKNFNRIRTQMPRLAAHSVLIFFFYLPEEESFDLKFKPCVDFEDAAFCM